MLKYSILVPTRERIKPLNRLLNSIYITTNRRDQIEVLIAYDDDDEETKAQIERTVERYKIINVKAFNRPRTEFLNRDYYGWLATQAKGKFIWVCADDLVFLVPNWDVVLWEKLNVFLSQHPDRLVCANILDNTPAPGEPPGDKSEFPCFPLFSREVLDVLGFILPPQLPTWGADRYVHDLFTKVGRFLVINDACYLDHVSYHTKAMEADAVTTRMGEICAKYAKIDKHKPHKQDPIIATQAHQLLEYIEQRRVNATL